MMAISKRFRPIKVVEGAEYIFNASKLKQCYNDEAMHLAYRGAKTHILEELESLLGYTVSTIRGYIAGHYSPSAEAVPKIANYFDLEEGDFLIVRPVEGLEMGTNMREIPAYERDAARKIYGQLCDMAEGMYYSDPELLMKFDVSCTMMGFRYLGPTPHPFEYRDSIILSIRKMGFDLPHTLRDSLIELVREVFGDDCGEEGLLYLRSDNYKSYLEKNGFKDNDDTRELYSINYVRNLYDRIDALFKDYAVD